MIFLFKDHFRRRFDVVDNLLGGLFDDRICHCLEYRFFIITVDRVILTRFDLPVLRIKLFQVILNCAPLHPIIATALRHANDVMLGRVDPPILSVLKLPLILLFDACMVLPSTTSTIAPRR